MNTRPCTGRLSRFVVLLICIAAFSGRSWGETVRVNGIDMCYETIGLGQPLLLLHGFTQTGTVWEPIKGELASGFQLIIPDLRGHGSSTNPSGKFTHRQAALDIFALLDHLELERVQAMGISAGGMTLLHMATQQPDRIDAMVLIGAAPYFPEQDREELRKVDPNDVPEERMQRLRQIHKYGDEQIRAILSQFNGFKDSYDDMNFTSPYLSTISARTLIVYGDRDRYFPVSIALQMYEAIPHAYLWIVPNGGHVPVFGPTQEYFVCTAKAFLRDQWEVIGRRTPVWSCK